MIIPKSHMRAISIVLLCILGCAESITIAQDDDFKAIFDGSTINGWNSDDMSYWSLQDGAITGNSTVQNPAIENQVLTWQLGQVDDFELKLKYRISPTEAANLSIRFRSSAKDDGQTVGYNAGIGLVGRYAGALYEETGRGILAAQGQKSDIDSDGKMTHTTLTDAESPLEDIEADQWNDCHITASGNHIILKINEKVTAEISDNDGQQVSFYGTLALQFEADSPVTVQFKDIQLKRLKLIDRKKIVLVAGRRSHGYGSHEHNAGCLLLQKCLNENMSSSIYATTYLNGWPTDSTAFDNADALVFFCDGGRGHVVMQHLEEVDKLAKNGVGIAMLHYAVEVPTGEPGGYMLDWIGGYFETYWSVNPFWDAAFEELPEHPITRGVRPFTINDEWYYHMRFVEDMNNLTPILTAIPPDSTRREGNDAHAANPHVRARMGMPEHVAWAYERTDGGRGFGFTGGHWHYNWASDDFRKLILNSIVWIAGAEVPPDGVPSKTPSIQELEEDQDFPKSGVWDLEQIQEMILQWNSR